MVSNTYQAYEGNIQMKCFEFIDLNSAMSEDGGPVFPDDRMRIEIPKEAEEILGPILGQYGQDPRFYFSRLNGGRPPAPWAIACFNKEYSIAGHIATNRPNKSIAIAQYTIVSPPIPNDFIPQVGIISIFDKTALEDVSKKSLIFEKLWDELKDKPIERNWLLVLDALPNEWLEKIVQNDSELWLSTKKLEHEANESVLSLVNDIMNTPASEFWYNSSLLNKAKKHENPRIVKALAIRHHYLGNKQAGSCHVLRQTIKSIEGPYLNSLWQMLESEDEDEQNAGLYILAEIGGITSFHIFMNLLAEKVQKQEYSNLKLIISGIAHNVNRYHQISEESEPEMQIMDVETGEVKSVSQKEFADDIYERTLNDRKQANEYFSLPESQMVKILIVLLGEVPEAFFPSNIKKQQFLDFLDGFFNYVEHSS